MTDIPSGICWSLHLESTFSRWTYPLCWVPIILCLNVVFVAAPKVSAQEVPLPDPQLEFLKENCLNCHDQQTQEAEINLQISEVNWSQQDTLLLWERIHNALESGEMPPPESSELDDSNRQMMVKWIDKTLVEHTPIGGTLARRLNQAEYKATIESLFGFKNFELPQGFPIDREHHGFDNQAEGLVLSPPLLESYSQCAQLIADEIFPPKKKHNEPVQLRAAAQDLVISYSSSKVVDGAMRLGMKCAPIMRSCTWPARIEAAVSGSYTVSVTLSAFRPRPGDPPMIAKIFARDVASNDSVRHNTLRILKVLEVTEQTPQTFSFQANLYAGQTVVLHWANASLDSDREDKADLQEFFRKKEKQNPRYLAAWNAMLKGEQGQGFRGGIGWERVKAQLSRDDLPQISESEREALLKKIAGNPVLYAETVVFDVFENGPALQIHSLEVEGPHKLIEGPYEIERKKRQEKLFVNGTTDREKIHQFLSKAFRRPVDDDTLDIYMSIHDQHLEAGHTAEESLHLLIRNVLISPRFLYRSLGEGALDDYDLASRLSYFLTGGPPDDKLWRQANAGELTDGQKLKAEAVRLLPQRAAASMIQNFTGQWLDTRLLTDIMPDPKFKFNNNDEIAARLEVEHFFFEMLDQNRPMTDFIDPDFTWTSARLAKNIYGLKDGYDKKKTKAVQRITLPRGGKHGGLLGQSAILMATANGVDTQPVLRGVWVLENILGTPPPPPPQAVPPITPDTFGAKNPRELLAAHTTEKSCAGCHRRIDPVGFVLENFDPVGRWRENWPGIAQPIDASSTLPDGTRVNDIVDFKKWLVQNIDQFSQCLSEKLMTYATGRAPNYSERKEIAAIVKRNHENGNKFRDLLLALIESESFRTK